MNDGPSHKGKSIAAQETNASVWPIPPFLTPQEADINATEQNTSKKKAAEKYHWFYTIAKGNF